MDKEKQRSEAIATWCFLEILVWCLNNQAHKDVVAKSERAYLLFEDWAVSRILFKTEGSRIHNTVDAAMHGNIDFYIVKLR